MADNDTLKLSNINELAQSAASVVDGDYIYIYKAGANTFARIERSVFMQGASCGGISDDVYNKIKNNVNAVNDKLDTLIGLLAGYALSGDKPATGSLDWDSEEEPVVASLTSPTNGSTVNVGTIAASGTSVSKSVHIKGANITQELTISISGTGLSVNMPTVTAAQANNGINITVTYTNSASGAATTSGTLTISSSEVSVNVNLTASKQDQSITYRTISGSFTGCGISTLPIQVENGGIFNGTLVANTGYTLPNDVTINGTYGAKTYNASDGTLMITNITSDITITAVATPDAMPSGYVTNGMVLHLDGLNQGGTSGHWIDTVGRKDFALSNATPTNNGVSFDSSDDRGNYTGSNLGIDYDEGTIEVVFTPNSTFVDGSTHRALFGSNRDNEICLMYKATSPVGWVFGVYGTANTYTNIARRALPNGASIGTNPITLSINSARTMQNGIVNTEDAENTRLGIEGIATLTVGGMHRVGDTLSEIDFFANATIHEVRIYNRVLTESEMLQNQRYDNERYNLGLTI